MRQDEPRDARSHDPRLEGRDGRRRHLLDEVRRRRSPVRDQPRGGLLRRRTGNRLVDERERDAHAHRQLPVHEHRSHAGRRRLVGGNDRRAARTRHGLARPGVDSRVDDSRGASERTLHRTRVTVPVDRPRVAGPARRADLGDPLRRSPSHDGSARHRGVRLGSRRVPRLDHGERDDCGAGRCGRQAALRSDGDAALLRVQHGRLLRPLAAPRQEGRRVEVAEDLLRQLVPPRRQRPLPVARLRREQSRAEVGVRARRRQGRRRAHAHRHAADDRCHRHDQPRRGRR